MISYIDNWFYQPTIVIMFAIITITFGCGLQCERKRRLAKQSTKIITWFCLEIAIFTITIFSALTLTEGCLLIREANQHGMYQEQLTWKELQDNINHSPTEDILPNNLENTLIIYYKFGCKDCESIYADLQTQLKGLSNVYWVSTRSKQGTALRDKYPVSKVPSGMYITTRKTAVIKPLYQSKDEQAVLNQKNLTSLLNLYESNIEQ